MTTNTETAMTNAASTLGVELKYPPALADALKRREATEALRAMERRDAARELNACPNPHRFDSLLGEIAAHNARVDVAKAAVHGGVHAAALGAVELEFARFETEYIDQTFKTVNAAVNAFIEAAQHCPTLDPAQAVNGGCGDRLTAVHEHGRRILAHLDALAVKASSHSQRASDRLAAIVATDEPITALRVTLTRHRAQVSQTLSSPAEVANRNAARGLISDAQQDMLATLHGIARGDHPGFTLNASTGDGYPARRAEWRNADATIRVEAD